MIEKEEKDKDENQYWSLHFINATQKPIPLCDLKYLIFGDNVI